jgi:hypothetical protein
MFHKIGTSTFWRKRTAGKITHVGQVTHRAAQWFGLTDPCDAPINSEATNYSLTGAIFAANPFGVIRYASSWPLPVPSIQPFISSFDINFALSGKFVARRHSPPRKYCRNCRSRCAIGTTSSEESSNSTPMRFSLIQAILQFRTTRSRSVISRKWSGI